MLTVLYFLNTNIYSLGIILREMCNTAQGVPWAVFHNSLLFQQQLVTITCIHSVTILTGANLLKTPLFYL
jgi:hypothetical protein